MTIIPPNFRHLSEILISLMLSDVCINGSSKGLSTSQHKTIIWTNAGVYLIKPLGTDFSEISIEIHTLPFNKMHLKISSAKCQPFFSWPQCVKLLKLFMKQSTEKWPEITISVGQWQPRVIAKHQHYKEDSYSSRGISFHSSFLTSWPDSFAWVPLWRPTSNNWLVRLFVVHLEQ